MVTIIYGPANTGKSRAMLQTVCRRAEQQTGGQILLVPDRKSHDMERELCTVGGDSICRYAEVLTFSRLAQRVFEQSGGLSQPALDDAGRVLAMAQAVELVRTELRYYSSVIAQPEYLTAFTSLSAEMKSYCVTPTDLKHAADRLGGVLSVKLTDLSLILSAYQLACDKVGADPRDQLTRLYDELQQTDWALGKHIYIDCFSYFTLQERNIIRQLISCAESVTICLTLDPAGGALFDAARQTQQQIRQMADACGRRFVSRAFLQLPNRDAALNAVQTHLLGSKPPQAITNNGSVQTILARDAVTACAEVAFQINRLVRSGARYRDIAVVWPQGTGYETLVESVFADWGVPVNLSRKQSVLQTPVISMILAALEAISGGWSREDVMCYARMGFSGCTAQELDRLENYAVLWNLHGSRWTHPFTLHPQGYGAEDDPTETLQDLNRIRAQLIDPLVTLRQRLYSAVHADEQVLAVYGLAEQIDLPHQLEDLTAQLVSQGRKQEAQEYSQLYGVLIQALEQMYAVCGQLVLGVDRFSRLLKLVLSQYSVAAIPTVLDAAEAGELINLRYRKPAHLFVLAAQEGSLPAYESGDSILTEADRQSLLQLGVSLAPDAEHRMNQALLDIYMVFSSPDRSLTVLCCAENQPSFVFSRLQTMFGPARTANDPPPQILRLAAAAAVAGDKGAEAALRQYGPAANEVTDRLKKAAAYRLGVLPEQQVQQLYGKTLNLTVSRMEQWAKCRFWHFCSYGLRLSERQVADFDPLTFGTFVHDVLEKLTRRVRQLGGFSTVDQQQLEKIADEMIQDFTQKKMVDLQGREARLKYLFHRARHEVLDIVRELGRELRVSDFVPAYFELAFGRSDTLPAIAVDRGTVHARVSGVVDRVDLYEENGQKWLRVVDYKTGTKSFDYTEMTNGLNLQMPVYLFALQAAGVGRPAGILYFPARSGLIRTDHHLNPDELEALRREKLARSGLVTENPVILAAMEHWQNAPQYLPIKIKKTGEITGSLVSDHQWEQLQKFIGAKLLDAADGISGGLVEPNPYTRGTQEACDYCPYGAVCRQQGTRRYLRHCSQTEFWKMLEQEEKQNG